MTDARTLLFGDDSSPSSDIAFSFVDQQSWPGWKLHIVHAEPAPWGKPIPESEVTPHPWDPPQRRTVSDTANFDEVAHLFARVDPRIALMGPADLVVIGPRGKGLLKALNLGSVSEFLLAHPPTPLVIARTGTPVRQVLVTHDTSHSADRALQTFASLPWAASTAVTLVVVDDHRVDAQVAVRKAKDALAVAGIEPEVVLHEGAPTGAIAGEIDRRRPELVVLGTRGLTGFDRFHLGSTAASIARSAPCSVLVACAETGGSSG
jgi:nucleotide-binding universal stress UspA family protein